MEGEEMIASVGFLVVFQGRSDGYGILEWLDTISPEKCI